MAFRRRKLNEFFCPGADENALSVQLRVVNIDFKIGLSRTS